MLTADDWLWTRLPDGVLWQADALKDLWLERVRAGGYPAYHEHTPDRDYQNRVGAEAEVAFRYLTGRPIPSVEDMAATWGGADVDGYAIKGIGQPHYRLLFQEKERLTAPKGFVLVYANRPRYAIVGRISQREAGLRRRWAMNLPTPAWAIRQEDLEAWDARKDTHPGNAGQGA